MGSQLSTQTRNYKKSKPSNSMKSVQFSDSSKMYFYPEDYIYSLTKSHSESTQDRFRQDALRDAVRIMKLLKQKSPKGDNERSLSVYLKDCGVSEEEILGIEHLVLANPRDISKRRKTHSRVVLMEYAEQLNEGCDDVHRLAQLSRILTKRPASQARERAARVAQLLDIDAKRPAPQVRNHAAKAA